MGGRQEAASRPTDGELAILRVLWGRGPSTVRQVHETLAGRRAAATGYTTTLKLMQIMVEKGSLLRDSSRRTHVYFPRESAEVVERGLVRDLIDRAFDGAAGRLVLSALGSRKVTKEEAARIRALRHEIEGGGS